MHNQPDCFLLWNHSSCMRGIMNIVRLPALSPTVFLPSSLGNMGWMRRWLCVFKNWAGCYRFCSQRLSVHLSTGIKENVLGIVAEADTVWSFQQWMMRQCILIRFVDYTKLEWIVDRLTVRGPIQKHLGKLEDLANRNFIKINKEKFCRGILFISKD